MTGDPALMARALALAGSARGATSPNPMVGAVLVRGGAIVGEGAHPRAGDPHAEIFALRAAGEAARGAELYVTLEPCSHHGRTGPCVDALIAAGIARAHIAQVDPNPLVEGRGVRALEAAGIAVSVGLLEACARRLNEHFNHWITARRPFVTLKLATSLDGRIATANGASQWITGPEARARVHELRAAHDAIMVGAHTALADDPRLTARGVDRPHLPPLRVIVDSRLRVPVSAKALDPSAPGRALVATAAAPDDPRVHALERLGVEVCSAPAGARVALGPLLDHLGQRQPPVTSVLVEGGGVLATSLVTSGRVDKIVWFVAPRLIGDDGRPSCGPLTLARPADGPGFATHEIARVGDDAMIIAYPRAPASGG